MHDFTRPDPIIGVPDQDSRWWDGQQSYPDTCAIRAQEFILEQFTGREIDEHALVQEAQNSGWYTPGQGTLPTDVGRLLEQHGIPVTRYVDANIYDLARELSQGHRVIIGLDSGELWSQHPLLEKLEDAAGIQGADHAVVVSGIDTSDPAQVRIIVSDPGTGEAVARYPVAAFLDAWQDSDFFMVATDTPAPRWLPEMAHFDYGPAHTLHEGPFAPFLHPAGEAGHWDGSAHPAHATAASWHQHHDVDQGVLHEPRLAAHLHDWWAALFDQQP